MTKQLLTRLAETLGDPDDPCQRFADMPSDQLAELAELAYQVAFWTGYQRNKRGEETEMVMRLDRDALWSTATKLPPPPLPPAGPEDASWLLDASGDCLAGLEAQEGLAERLSAAELTQLLEDLGSAAGIVRRELARRGLLRPRVRLLVEQAP